MKNPPTALNKLNMATLDINFVKMCTEAGIPEEVKKFFVAQGILEASDLAVLASNENEVKSEIVDPILAGGVTLTTLAQKGSIRKLWMACKNERKSHGQGRHGHRGRP